MKKIRQVCKVNKQSKCKCPVPKSWQGKSSRNRNAKRIKQMIELKFLEEEIV